MIVKKCALIVIGAILVAANTGHAGTVKWENLASWVYTRDGGAAKIPVANNWVIALYLDAGSDNIMDDYSPSASPVQTAQGGSWADDGYFFNSFSHPGGVSVFTRIYDSSSIGTATWYVNLDGGVKAIPTFALPTDSFSYDPGGTAANGADWKAIPEPASMALFGLGLATMAIGKRLRRK